MKDVDIVITDDKPFACLFIFSVDRVILLLDELYYALNTQ